MIIDTDLTNIYQSVRKYLTETMYTKGDNTNTLTGFFTGLSIIDEFPQDLTRITPPAIALSTPEEMPLSATTFGIHEIRYAFTIYGFAGGKPTDTENSFLRDSIRNDIKKILEDNFINLYSFPALSLQGSLEVIDVTSRNLPINIFDTLAEKFRFTIDFSVIMYAS